MQLLYSKIIFKNILLCFLTKDTNKNKFSYEKMEESISRFKLCFIVSTSMLHMYLFK